jgi:hypothetical protein
MTQIQITNHKSVNLLVIIGSTKVLHEIILKFRHLRYRRGGQHIGSHDLFSIVIKKTFILSVVCLIISWVLLINYWHSVIAMTLYPIFCYFIILA